MADLQQRAINALDNAQRDQESVKGQLLSAAHNISDRMRTLTAHLNSGDNHVINSLGELQAQGPNFDRLCALYAAAEERVKSCQYVLTEPVYCDCNRNAGGSVCGGRVRNDLTDTKCSTCSGDKCFH